MSTSGESLYLLVRAEEKDLKKLCQQQDFHLKLEIGFSDMISLEPCDNLLRPLNKIKPPTGVIADTIDKEEKNVKKWIDLINKIDLEKSGGLMPGEDDDDNEDDFDIDDVYTNDKISKGVWDSYIEYLKTLGKYLQKGSELKLYGELKGILLRKCFRAALKFTNANVPKKNKLYNLWGRMGY